MSETQLDDKAKTTFSRLQQTEKSFLLKMQMLILRVLNIDSVSNISYDEDSQNGGQSEG